LVNLIAQFQSSPAPKDGRYRTTTPEPEFIKFSSAFREPADCLSNRHIESLPFVCQLIVKSGKINLRDPPGPTPSHQVRAAEL